MKRILVKPEELEGLGLQFRRAALDLRRISSRLGGALAGLDWEARQQAGVEDRVRSAQDRARSLADQSEQICGYLLGRAHDFARADAAGLQSLRGLALSGAARSLSAWETAAGGIWAWTGAVALFGSMPRNLAGPPMGWIATILEEMRTPGTAADRTGPIDLAEPPPAPRSTRLPLDEEVRYIQAVFGIEGETGYGVRTRRAVRLLQRRHGLGVDSESRIGPNTWNLVLRVARGEAESPMAALDAVAPGPVQSPEHLRQRFAALGWRSMEQWSDLIYARARDAGLPPEVLAAKIMQESGGLAAADAGPRAGKGLMQIEFGPHRGQIPGGSDAEKLAWIMEPGNNVDFGARMLKGVLNQWIQQYGPDEGLKRGLQYWNYGAGAAKWVEARSISPDDWQYWVDRYHDTHLSDGNNGLLEAESGGDYGNPQHWQAVYSFYEEIRWPEGELPGLGRNTTAGGSE